jgi:hypothetical protein
LARVIAQWRGLQLVPELFSDGRKELQLDI